MTNWSDGTLDRGDEEMEEGFARLEEQINTHRHEMKERFAKVDERLVQTVTRQELKESVAEVRVEMREAFDKLERQITANRREMLGAVVAIVVALIGPW